MRIAILGAGGFSREVADLVEAAGHRIAGFWDEDPGLVGTMWEDFRIVGDLSSLSYDALTIAVGDVGSRARIFAEHAGGGVPFPTIFHPSASVSPRARVGDGCLIMQNVVVNAAAVVADDAILNVDCCVAHDCRVGAHCHIAPAVQMGGFSSVGDRVFCGTGSVLLPGIAVGDGATVGAGAVVTKDVAAGTTVVGVPARALDGMRGAR